MKGIPTEIRLWFIFRWTCKASLMIKWSRSSVGRSVLVKPTIWITARGPPHDDSLVCSSDDHHQYHTMTSRLVTNRQWWRVTCMLWMSTWLFMCGSSCLQKWKLRLLNDSKALCTATENKANANRIFANITLSYCVRQRLIFEDNSVINVGYSGNWIKHKLISEHMKLKTSRRLQTRKGHEEFPLNCDGKVVSGVILSFLILMFPIFIHVSLFIFFFNVY
jgi:hypothetical protein